MPSTVTPAPIPAPTATMASQIRATSQGKVLRLSPMLTSHRPGDAGMFLAAQAHRGGLPDRLSLAPGDGAGSERLVAFLPHLGGAVANSPLLHHDSAPQ